MIYIFYVLAAALVFLSYKSFASGIKYLKFVEGELAKPPSGFHPPATIFVPCKGLDQGLSENLTSLLEQEYPHFEIIFVVDDSQDPAVAVIEDARKNYPIETKLVIARKAVYSSQKVENLREAIQHASTPSEIFVFADSDARPQKDWLSALAAPLADDSVGVSTGYRWFLSETRSFASEMRATWNASIASSLGARSSFCWAGAMAIRRETFENLNVRGRWKGTVSDDFTLARIMSEAGLVIRFVPAGLTPSIESCKFREMIEFTTRQMKLTFVYARQLWLVSLVGSAVFNIVMLWAVLIVFTPSPAMAAFWAALSTLALVTFFSVGKSLIRLRAVRIIMKDHQQLVDRQILPQCILWALTPAVFLYNCVAAAVSRTITWRGITYEMVSAHETKVR